jgi:hypothetical protein
MGDILKEAIADAKAVRETALQNAKMALEEAFTPQLKSMLSAKLKEDEMGDEEEVDIDDDEAEEGAYEGAHEGEDDEEEIPAEEGHYEGAHEDEEMGEEEPEMEEEVVEINGVKYAPVVAEEEEDEGDDEIEEGEGELDLESIIRELESELSEGDEEDEEPVEEAETSYEEPVEEAEISDEDTVEEEYEIDESVFTEGEDDEDEEEVEESNTSELESELKEYKDAVRFLKDKLHEVNILNAKLLFTNKLFKEYALDNNQKLKVVETFDRAQTTREIKLVYSTLAEQFGDNGSIVTRKSISESASSAVASTKPSKESRKVITEEDAVANRFKKLAGLIK